MSSLDRSTHVQTVFIHQLKFAPVVGPPRVPIQVAEYVMDMLAGHSKTLCSCALTCSEWHPRARYHLLTSIRFIGDVHQTQDRLSSLRDYLDAHSDITSRVHRCLLNVRYTSLSSQEAWNFLLLQFPALRSLVIARDDCRHSCLHPTTYARIKAHILLEELVLHHVWFCTSAEFAQLLVALPRLKRLECDRVELQNQEDTEISASMVRRFKNKGQMLSRLEICDERNVSIVCVLISMFLSTLEKLHLRLSHFDGAVDLSQLQKLHLLQLDMRNMWDPSTMFHFISSILSGITQNLHIVKIICKWTLLQSKQDHNNFIQGCHTLENTLLEIKLGKPHLVFHVYPFMAKNRSLLAYELLTHRFSHLHKSGRLHVKFEPPDSDNSNNYRWDLGHRVSVTALAVSDNGDHFATGDENGTVIIWSSAELHQTALAQLQHPDVSKPITSLIFSKAGDSLAAVYVSSISIWHSNDHYLVGSIKCPFNIHACHWGLGTVLGYIDISALGATEDGTVSISTTTRPVLPPQNLQGDALGMPIPPLHSTITALGSLGQKYDKDSILEWSSSGRFIAAQMTEVGTKLWDRYLVDTEGHGYEPYLLVIPDKSPQPHPRCLTFTANEELLIVGFEGCIVLWDISALPSSIVHPFKVLSLQPDWPSNLGSFTLSGMSPQSSFLIATFSKHAGKHNDSIRTALAVLQQTQDFERSRSRCQRQDFKPHFFLYGSNWKSMWCLSPCERYLAFASDGDTVSVVNVFDGSLMWTFECYLPMHIAFTSSGILILVQKSGKVSSYYWPKYVRDSVSDKYAS